MGKNSFQNEIPPARVNIQLSVAGSQGTKKKELPLKMLVLGRFRTSSEKCRIAERQKISVRQDNFDAVMQSLDLQLHLDLETEPATSVHLHFTGLRSFDPANIVTQVPALGRLLAARNLIRDLGSNLMDNRSFRRELEDVLRDPNARAHLMAEVSRRIQMVQPGESQ